jgi:ATP-dependent exoDNAse (exonuclease V) beta subunit
MRDYLEASRRRFENSLLFSRCTGCEDIQKELPFIAAIGDHIVNGVVDVLLPDGTMIDYKTGAPTPRKLDRYTRQLHLYAAALRAVDPTLVSGACVYYVDTGDIVEIDLSPEAVGATLAQVERVFAPRKHAG